MPANIFGVDQKLAGQFRADLASVSFGGNVKGMLVQNIQFSFTQQITLLYEIGSADVYYVGGRAQGTATVARVVGPGQAQTALIKKYGDVCQAGTLTFTAEGGCGKASGSKVNYEMTGVVLTTLAVSVSAQDIVINEQLQFMFANLNLT